MMSLTLIPLRNAKVGPTKPAADLVITHENAEVV